jgi:hypothetical protein
MAQEKDPLGDDLQETCSILDHRYGRQALVEALRMRIGHLEPTGGLLSLPAFDWAAIYTTNFDEVVEKAYRRAGKPLNVVRSNMDYGSIETRSGTPLFKLHGCISRDTVDGHADRLVLTERDNEESERFRQALFQRLKLDMLTKDCVVIGSSLRDPDVRLLMDQAAKLHSDLEAPGRLFALIHVPDQDRAAIQEKKGYRVAWGGGDDFVRELTESSPPEPPVEFREEGTPALLPVALNAVTIDALHAAKLAPDALKLYNGSPASYADIRVGLTVSRTGEQALVNSLRQREVRFTTVLGTAGVGKTTLARRLAWGIRHPRGGRVLAILDAGQSAG